MPGDCREAIARIEDSEVRKDSRSDKEERVNQLNKPIPLNTSPDSSLLGQIEPQSLNDSAVPGSLGSHPFSCLPFSSLIQSL